MVKITETLFIPVLLDLVIPWRKSLAIPRIKKKEGVSVVVSCVCFVGGIGSFQGSQGYENPGFDPG
jgi:hypothetical protein